MRSLAVFLLFWVLLTGAFAQAPSSGALPESNTGAEWPSFQSVKPLRDFVRPAKPRTDFLKRFTFESFGYSRSPTGTGFEFPWRMTEGSFTSHDLECPRCLIRPAMERSRYTLPPFGVRAAMSGWRGRVELFGEFGGVNEWKPNNTLLELGPRGKMRSFNDAWLLQGVVGGRVAVDHDRHLWLGGAARYLESFSRRKAHWNSISGNATFLFGR